MSSVTVSGASYVEVQEVNIKPSLAGSLWHGLSFLSLLLLFSPPLLGGRQPLDHTLCCVSYKLNLLDHIDAVCALQEHTARRCGSVGANLCP